MRTYLPVVKINTQRPHLSDIASVTVLGVEVKKQKFKGVKEIGQKPFSIRIRDLGEDPTAVNDKALPQIAAERWKAKLG